MNGFIPTSNYGRSIETDLFTYISRFNNIRGYILIFILTATILFPLYKLKINNRNKVILNILTNIGILVLTIFTFYVVIVSNATSKINIVSVIMYLVLNLIYAVVYYKIRRKRKNDIECSILPTYITVSAILLIFMIGLYYNPEGYSNTEIVIQNINVNETRIMNIVYDIFAMLIMNNMYFTLISKKEENRKDEKNR